MTLIAPGWDTARAAAHGCGHPLGVETVPLSRADGRVLASHVTALTALPPFDTSAMDGWAVAGSGPWRVVGRCLAGEPATAIADGEAVTIATGAPVPAEALCVLRSEHGRLDTDGLLRADPAARLAPGDHVRPRGEEAAAGEVLLPAGSRLTPARLGLTAAGGADDLVVARRPTAKLLLLGDELLETGPATDGRVRDSLGPQLPRWLRRLGVAAVGVSRVADTLSAHVAALEAAADVSIVVTTGGTAAGPADHLRAALLATGGESIVDGVAVRPGRPMLLGRWGEARWLLGLPGNPQSAIAALFTLGSPLVAALLGLSLPTLGYVRFGEFIDEAADTRLVLSALSDPSTASPVPYRNSAMLRGLAAASGFAVIPPGGADAGDPVRWLPLPA